MSGTRRRFLAAVAPAVVIAGCLDGASGDDPTATPTDGPTPTDEPTPTAGSDGETATPGAPTEVGVRAHEEFGDVLVDGEGVTLYMFDADTQGEPESACGADCVTSWPPLTGSNPDTGEGVEASLSTFERDDGDTQVAANGWPLYYYTSDSEPGHARGQGVSDVWWVLDPAGNPIGPDDGGAGGY